MAEESGPAQLRSLVRMPTISVSFGWSFASKSGLKLDIEKPMARDRIAEIEKNLTGSPADAERYFRLGELYLDVPDYEKARNANVKAVACFRKRVELEPDNGPLLADFGEALYAASIVDEAEGVLRKAVKVAPKSAECWDSLGGFLEKQAASKFGYGPRANKPSAENVAAAQRLLDESTSCFEKAVACSTNESMPYVQRAMNKWTQHFFKHALERARGQIDDEEESARSAAAKVTLADLEKAVQLDPRNVRVIATALMMEVFAANENKTSKAHAQVIKYEEMADPIQRSIRAKLALLEKLTQSADAKTAAAATEMLAFCQGPMLGDLAGCFEGLRRVIQLDPGRQGAWHMLIAGLAGQGRLEEAARVCQENIAHKDSSLNRILYAKTLFKLNRLTQADEQVRAALRLDPNDFAANVGLAAITVKRGTNLSDLIQAEQPIGRAEIAIQNKLEADREGARQAMIDFCLTKAIYCGLTERVETAQEYAKHVLTLEANNQEAKAVLAALNR